jgi:hypothetical protein
MLRTRLARTIALTAAAALAGSVLAAPGPVAQAAARAAIQRPSAAGRLRITGLLRDGGTVAAAGLRWRPGRLPRGDRLLSFEVGYAWQACTPAGGRTRCRSAADTTATPFAARRYIVGHADTGLRLRVTETASEVVETDPATFAFTVLSSSASVTTRPAVAAYPAARAPVTEFVNGTPEPETASDAEYFQVDGPHYRASDGTPVLRYRVDSGSWRRLAASRLLYTGKLGVGRHQVQVSTANAAGVTTIRFGWRVEPMPRPARCRPRPRRACWYPPHLNAKRRPMR